MFHQSVGKAVAAATVAVALMLSSASGAQARPWPDGVHSLRSAPAFPGLSRSGLSPVPRAVPMRLAEGRPSAAAIEDARRRNGLPASARAVGWRLVGGAGGKVWKIIFRVGNRQVAVEIPAGG
jgi:hypothetical protein